MGRFTFGLVFRWDYRWILQLDSDRRSAKKWSRFRRTLLRYVRFMPWAVRLSSVCRLSVCRLWRGCTLRRDLNFSAIFLHHLIAQRLGHFILKSWEKFEEVLGDRASYIQVGMKNWRFSTNNRFISKTVQDTAIVTMEYE